VEAWLASAKHPGFGRGYDQLTYQPQQQLLAYLRADGFENFIVSGGGADFMRVWAERVYSIPPEQVIGSTGTVGCVPESPPRQREPCPIADRANDSDQTAWPVPDG